MPRCLLLLQQICLVFIITLCCHLVPTYQYEGRLNLTTLRHKPHLFYSGTESVETLSWVVRLDVDILSSTKEELDVIAELIAEDTRLVNHGQVGELRGHYLFVSPLHQHILRSRSSDTTTSKSHVGATLMRENLTFTSQGNLSHADWERVKLRSLALLDTHPYVDWHIQQLVRSRSKRDFFVDLVKTQRHRDLFNQTESYSEVRKRTARGSDLNNPLQFNDPLFPKQWHLVNTYNRGRDINISGIWLRNITGRGVTIAVVDDGLEWTNPDLAQNYNADGSFDLNSNDADPSPSSSKVTNHHGTRCAGEIAAVANNKICGVGVAFQAMISGIRILDGPMTDDLEAVAFTKKLDVNDVYSCSWGPEDDGKTVDGPQHLAMIAMRHGVDYGRQGYGAIYVVASGNGGRVNDNCNYDGYANSIYTVTVGAIDEDGEMPDYGESCASMLAATYSSGGGGYQRNIVTTDWTQNGGTGCTENHSGTSAAAPIASSLIGLMLQARPCLTWRDVQYIIAVAAVKVDISKSEWTRNAAGLYHSHQHGFGELKAWRMVNTAKVWETIPWLTLFTSKEINANLAIPPTGSVLAKYEVTEKMLDGYNLKTLEYVHVRITLTHERRGDVSIELICPSGTSSIIGATRRLDESRDGFKGWTFSTVRCWGEQPLGVWTLKITDTGNSGLQSRGSLIIWQLHIYGSMMTSTEVAERIRLVDEASSGKYLNDSYHLPCQPPPVHTKLVEPLSERLLKMLVLTGSFLMIMALYETLEYIFCYNEEKKEQANLLQLSERAHRLSEQQSPDEVTRLLHAEEIEMETVASTQEPRNGPTFVQHEVPPEQDLLLALDEELNEHEAWNNTPHASGTEEVLNRHHETVINRGFCLGEDVTDDLIIELNKELDGVDLEEVNPS